jgi:hypothetical protein
MSAPMPDASAAGFELRHAAFSHPSESFDLVYAETITVTRTRRLVTLFLRQWGGLLDKHGEGARAMLEAFLQSKASFDTVWDPAFGRLRHAFATRPADLAEVVRAAAMMLCRLTEKGMPGHFRLELIEPGASSLLCLFGHLLPSVHRIEVNSDGESALIETVGGAGKSRFRLSAQGFFDERGEISASAIEGTVRLPRVGTGKVAAPEELEAGELLILPEQFLPGMIDRPIVVPIGEASVEGYEAAFRVLRDHAPHFHTWVRRVVRRLVLLGTRRGTLNSFSMEFAPGLVALSLEASPLSHAELLVHEATHQHCYLLMQLGRLDDGSDTNLYYSPVRRMERPIAAILLGYHAFGNILLFYRVAHQAGFADPKTCLRIENEIWPQLRELEMPLRRTQALTPLGRAIFEPLAQRLASIAEQT